MLYNIVLVSAIHQHESAIGIHMSHPPLPRYPIKPPPASYPISRLPQSPGFELPASHSKCTLAVCSPHGDVCVSGPLSQFVPPAPSPRCPQVWCLCLCLYCCPAKKSAALIMPLPSSPTSGKSYGESEGMERAKILPVWQVGAPALVDLDLSS